MTALEDAWDFQESLVDREDGDALCFLDLRRRVEALEQRAATEESSATEPAQRHPIKPRTGVLNASIKASMDRIQALVADLTEPAPAPAADRPLWEVMYDDCCAAASEGRADLAWRTAAEIDAVAEWLAAREHCGAASALRIQARRAREGQ